MVTFLERIRERCLTSWSGLVYTKYFLLLIKCFQVLQLKPVLEEIERRSLRKEYNQLLAECHRLYCEQRLSLVSLCGVYLFCRKFYALHSGWW